MKLWNVDIVSSIYKSTGFEVKVWQEFSYGSAHKHLAIEWTSLRAQDCKPRKYNVNKIGDAVLLIDLSANTLFPHTNIDFHSCWCTCKTFSQNFPLQLFLILLFQTHHHDGGPCWQPRNWTHFVPRQYDKIKRYCYHRHHCWGGEMVSSCCSVFVVTNVRDAAAPFLKRLFLLFLTLCPKSLAAAKSTSISSCLFVSIEWIHTKAPQISLTTFCLQ